jgi:lipopolysaccharide transport system permease protein
MKKSIIENEQQWSEIIEPKTKLFDLQLKEVWKYKDLLILFVKRDMAAQYKQTVLGPIWYIIQPIFTTFVYFFVFNKLGGIKTDPVPAPIFYMCGISLWNYFSYCFTSTSTTFVSNANIFGKVYFPRLVLPLSVVLSNIIKFGIQFLLLMLVILYYVIFEKFSLHIGVNVLLLPIVIIVMAGLGLGGGIIASALTTKYRDFTILINFGVQLLMYVTPVIYSLKFVADKHPKYQNLILSNPLSSLLETFRYALLGFGNFSIGWFLYSCTFMFILLFVGMVIFNKVERSFMDTV